MRPTHRSRRSRSTAQRRLAQSADLQASEARHTGSERSELPENSRAQRASAAPSSATTDQENGRFTGKTNPPTSECHQYAPSRPQPAAAMKASSNQSRDSAPRRSCLATSDRWKRPTRTLEHFVPTVRLASHNSAHNSAILRTPANATNRNAAVNESANATRSHRTQASNQAKAEPAAAEQGPFNRVIDSRSRRSSHALSARMGQTGNEESTDSSNKQRTTLVRPARTAGQSPYSATQKTAPKPKAAKPCGSRSSA